MIRKGIPATPQTHLEHQIKASTKILDKLVTNTGLNIEFIINRLLTKRLGGRYVAKHTTNQDTYLLMLTFDMALWVNVDDAFPPNYNILINPYADKYPEISDEDVMYYDRLFNADTSSIITLPYTAITV